MKNYESTQFITNSTEQSSSWEAKRFLVSQEIPRILWNPNVDYRIHYSPPPVPILNQTNPVHDLSHFRKIHFNITLPSIPGFSKWSISLRFSHQSPVCTAPTSQKTVRASIKQIEMLTSIIGDITDYHSKNHTKDLSVWTVWTVCEIQEVHITAITGLLPGKYNFPRSTVRTPKPSFCTTCNTDKLFIVMVIRRFLWIKRF